MDTLIDASVLIAAERGQLDLGARLAEHAAEGFAIATITASELLHGVHRVTKPEQRTRREAFIEQLLGKLPVIPFDLVAARVHARIWAQLSARGIVVGAHDLLLAATAIAHGCQVVTRDKRGFSRVPGLSLMEW